MAKKPTIVLHIEIDASLWGVDWKDKDDKQDQLEGLQQDLSAAFTVIGIEPETVTITKCETK